MLPSDLARSLVYRRWYPGARIAMGARARGGSFSPGAILERGAQVADTVLEGNTRIAADAALAACRLGAYSYVGPQTILRRVTTGRFCSIGPRCLMGVGEHPVSLLSTSPAFYSSRKQCGATFASSDLFCEFGSITLGSDVWVGAQAFVRDGVTIGCGAVVAAGAVVVKDVPAYAIVGGVPAKVIRHRYDEGVVAELLSLCWWDWDAETLKAAQPLLAGEDPEALLTWATDRGLRVR